MTVLKTYDVLEIAVSGGGGQYSVGGQFFPADVTAEEDTRVEPKAVVFEQEAAADDDDEGIEARLTDFLFAQNDQMTDLFELAIRDARSAKPLRVRLVIATSARELQHLPWETLQHPQLSGPLLLDERILFSRYMFADDWAPSSASPPLDPSATVLLANPSDLDAYGSEDDPPAPVDAELATVARDALTGWRFDERGTAAATLESIGDALRAKPDVIYLVCHGLSTRSGSILLLERDDGTAHEVSTIELIDKMRMVGHVPRLVVLGSCSSGGEGDAAIVRSELGPLLCQEGVPAVVAMRGRVSQATAKDFLKTFFEQVDEHGQLDLAMAAARWHVKDETDWSVPILFTRLRSGRLFARSRADEGFDKWPRLLTAIANQKCVPVIGPGASEWLCGSRADMAYRLAREFGFPLALPQRSDLPQVAQFLAVDQSSDVLRIEVRRKLWEGLYSRYQHNVSGGPPSDAELADNRALNEVFKNVAVAERWNNDDAEPHLVLAGLEFPMYLSTEPLDLMANALEFVGRTPVIRGHYQWRAEDDDEIAIDWPDDEMASESAADSVEAPASKVELDPDRPIVYHLFGSLNVPNSVTLTEDEYFEWMFGYATEANAGLNSMVQEALTWKTLLFIGFRIDDWDLRVLLRAIQRFAGGLSRRSLPHLAVQIDPDEDRAVRPDRARKYLAELLDVAHITVYWGSTETFCRELQKAHRAKQRGSRARLHPSLASEST